MKRLETGRRAVLAAGLAVLAGAFASTPVALAASRSKGLAGRFAGTAKLNGQTKRAELELVHSDFGVYRGGCTFKVSLDDPGISCSAEARDLGRNRVQVLLNCEDGSRQEWRGKLTLGGKKLTGKIEGTEPTLTGSFSLHRGR